MTIRGSIPSAQFSDNIQTDLYSLRRLQWVHGIISPWVLQPWCAFEGWRLFSAEVKNAWSYTSTLPTHFHREDGHFTFTSQTKHHSNLRYIISAQHKTYNQHTTNTGQRTQQPNSHFAVSEEPQIIVRLLSAGTQHCQGPHPAEALYIVPQSVLLAGIQTQYKRERRGTTTRLNSCQNPHIKSGHERMLHICINAARRFQQTTPVGSSSLPWV